MRKPFDKQLFEENDVRARTAVSGYLRKIGWIVRDNPDRYGVDLLLQTKELEYDCLAIECEIKRVWSGSEFPWKTIQLPMRKAKFVRSADMPVNFWVLNSECTHAIVIPGSALSGYAPVEVPNKYVAAGEKFYQIPVFECRKVNLNE